MTIKTISLIVLGIISLGVSLLTNKNKKKSNETRKRMLKKVDQAKNIERFKNSLDFKHPISNSIINLLENMDVHDGVGEKLNEEEKNLSKKKSILNYQNLIKFF